MKKLHNDKNLFLKADFNDEEKLQLINIFYECYFNTNQDTDVFSEEFFYLVGNIKDGYIPIKLEHLVDFIPCILEKMPHLAKYFIILNSTLSYDVWVTDYSEDCYWVCYDTCRGTFGTEIIETEDMPIEFTIKEKPLAKNVFSERMYNLLNRAWDEYPEIWSLEEKDAKENEPEVLIEEIDKLEKTFPGISECISFSWDCPDDCIMNIFAATFTKFEFINGEKYDK